MQGTILGRNPIRIAAFIGIALNLALTFGLALDAAQVALINALVVAGLALIVENGTTPTFDPRLSVGTAVNGGEAVVVSTNIDDAEVVEPIDPDAGFIVPGGFEDEVPQPEPQP